MSHIKSIHTKAVTIPMRRPFVTNLGQKSVSRNLEVRVVFDNGTIGFGEASASLALPDQTQPRMRRWIEKKAAQLIGLQTNALCRQLKQGPFLRDHSMPTALGALETAVVDGLIKGGWLSPASLLGKRRQAIETDITLSAWDERETLAAARHYWKQRFRRFKVKIGRTNLMDDIRRLDALAHAFPRARFWIDANQGLNVPQARQLIQEAVRRKWNIAGLEQPVGKKNITALKAVTDMSPFPVYADESASSLAAVKQLIKRKAVDGIVVKVAKTGLLEALRIVKLARSYRKKTMISCMAESEKGLGLSVLWALRDGKFDWVDLDSFALTRTRARSSRVRMQGPRLSLR